MEYLLYDGPMFQKDEQLKNLLRLEVARKGQTATYAFWGFALFSFFYGYGCVEFLPYIKGVSLALLLVVTCRFFLYRKIIKNNSISESDWRKMLVLVTMNGFGLGLIMALASFELKLSGVHFVVVTTLMAGLVGSSIVTLSYFPVLFIPFQSFMLLPQIGIILYLYFSPEKINYLPLIILYLMYFVYQLRQFRAYRKDLVQLFTYQIELENKNKELNDSKNVIIDQTVQLVHSSRLAVLGEMSAGIAHEINNPLTIISSCVQMLSRFGKEEKLDQSLVIRYSEKIYKSVDRISAIVRGLKHLANQSDRVPKGRVSIQDILDETTPFCLEHFNSLGITFRAENIPEIEIHCHSVQISQVLINLLKNASDAVAGELDSLERWIHLSFKQDSDFVYFIISNGGKKIPEQVSERIFSAFYTTKQTGTGLGLSISQTIMKDHGGELYFDPENFERTTFVIKHPLIVEN